MSPPESWTSWPNRCGYLDPPRHTVGNQMSAKPSQQVLLVDERVQPRYAAIALLEEVRSRVVERLTWHPASPPTGRHVVHGLDLTRDRVAVVREVAANLGGRLLDTHPD